uniref:Maturation protein n=1 Tax=O'Leary virus TaxID=2707246 RepID=A0A6H0DIS8_9VIRU|nr:MAG: maturation protein [O'Leary virus]
MSEDGEHVMRKNGYFAYSPDGHESVYQRYTVPHGQHFVTPQSTRFKDHQPSKLKTWLDHKGKTVYLTHTTSEKIDWRQEGMQRFVIKQYRTTEKDGTHLIGVNQNDLDRGADLKRVMSEALSLANKEPDFAYNQNELLTLAIAEANEATFDLGTFIGEMPETLQFLGAIVLKLLAIFKSIKSGKFGKEMEQYFRKGFSKRLIDDATDGWLAYRYAVMPLVYSLQDGLKALEPVKATFLRTRKRDSFTDEDTIIGSPYGSHQLSPCTASFSRETVARAQVYTILTAEQAKMRRYLLGPVTTAWELVPLSFVVDWVVQVGDFIASFRMLPKESQGITFSVKDKVEILAVASADSKLIIRSDGYIVSRIDGRQSLSYSKQRYTRGVIPNDFKHEIPVGVQMNLCRTIDAFSLAYKIGLSQLKRRH